VIKNDKIKTNYSLINLNSFMKYGGIQNSNVFSETQYFKPQIKNSIILEGADINKSWVAYRAYIEKSRVADGAKIDNYSRVAEKAIIHLSKIGENSKKSLDSLICKDATYY